MDSVDSKVEKLAKHLEGVKRIGVLSHVHPDGDAVGSVIGFYLFLKKIGKETKAILKDGVPYQYSFLDGSEEIDTQFDCTNMDLCVLLDASEFSRTGFPKPEVPLIRVDHHKTGEFYSDYDLVVTHAPATVSLVLEILRKWNEDLIDEKIARALYTGLLTDTVSFLHANSFTWAFKDALFLSSITDIEDIGSLVYERKRKAFYYLLVRAIERLTFKFGGKLAYTFIKNEDFPETGATAEDTDGIVRHVISIDGVEVGVNFIEYEKGIWKLSARGKGKVDLSLVCSELGGGGHKNAAGCSIKGSLDNAINNFLKVFEKWAGYL